MLNVNAINANEGDYWEELEYSSGELIALDNRDIECPHPFLIMKFRCGGRGHWDGKNTINFIYCPRGEVPEKRFIRPRGYALGLWPMREGKPVFEFVKNRPPNNPYSVERAFSGKETIQLALSFEKGYELYAQMIDNGKLILERGSLRRLVEAVGLGAMLSNPIRFRCRL